MVAAGMRPDWLQRLTIQNRTRGPGSRLSRPLTAVAIGAAIGLLVGAGVILEADAALVVMGFDPDRARLIDSLVVAFIAATMARILTDAFLGSALAGAAAFAALYGGTFASESAAAVAARGTFGSFDPAGWWLTSLTLLVVVGLVALAASAIGGVVRAFLVLALRDLREMASARRFSVDRIGRPVLIAATVVAVIVTGPVFGDMVNYTPDMHMRDGVAAAPGLVEPAGNGGVAAAGVGTGEGSGADGGGGTTSSSTTPTVTTTQGSIASSAPWLAWRPSAGGRSETAVFPAPWTGGSSDTTRVVVTLPPGYDTSPGRRYPVVYEAPYGPGGWAPLMPSFFTTGDAPAELMVSISVGQGPYPDSECVDSADGREHVESFIVNTVVPWIDSHYRTLAEPAARTIQGASQGGFCAPMLLLRHPDVFGQAISLSGYYTAGIESAETVNAPRPFDGDAALMRAYSPVDIAQQLSPDVRSRLFLVLGGNTSQPFFGPQLVAFAAELTRLGIAYSFIDDPLGHAWIGFERDLPIALGLVGLREARLGLFGPLTPGPAGSPSS